jgi:predicted MFS family arabinose efflux permease
MSEGYETQVADLRPRSGAWVVVALLWTVACLNSLDRIMITTMRDSIVQNIPMSEAQFGLLTSAFAWVYGLVSPFAGFLADRLRRSVVIVGSLFVWSLVTWLTAHASTFNELLFARSLMGISEACYIPAALALIADYHRGSTRSLATGIHMTGMFTGGALGGLGGIIAERQQWNSPFLYFGIFGMCYAIILIMFLREPTATSGPLENQAGNLSSPRFLEAIRTLFRSRSFNIALAYWGLLGIAGWAFAGWMPTFLKEHFDMSQSASGILSTGYLQVACCAGVVAGGFLADRWSRQSSRGPIVVTILGLLLAIPGVLLTAASDKLSFALAGLVIYGFTRSFSDANMMPILCLISDKRYRATGYGILNCASCLAGGLAVYAGGLLRDSNVNVSLLFQFAAVGLAVCATLLIFLRPQAQVEKLQTTDALPS